MRRGKKLRKVTRKKGRSSENNLIRRTAMVPTASPDEPGFAGITMLVTDTLSTTGVRFLPSFIDSVLAPCHPVVFSYCSSFPPSSPPSFLPFYILLSLSPRPQAIKCIRFTRTHAHPYTHARTRSHTHSHIQTQAYARTHTHAHAGTRTHARTHTHRDIYTFKDCS